VHEYRLSELLASHKPYRDAEDMQICQMRKKPARVSADLAEDEFLRCGGLPGKSSTAAVP